VEGDEFGTSFLDVRLKPHVEGGTLHYGLKILELVLQLSPVIEMEGSD
jgi:hypothetical protein